MAYHPLALITDGLFSDRFDRIDKLFSRLTGDVPLSETPSYDIIQKDKSNYEITVNVPGFKDNELDISVESGQLVISGTHEEKHEPKEGEKWLHKGIRRNTFNLRFNLEGKFNVQNANLAHGLLTVHLEHQIPEEEKPKKIAISTNENVGAVIEASKEENKV